MSVVIFGIVALVAVVLFLLVYNIRLHKKLTKYVNIKQKVTNLYVVQDFMTALGEDTTVDQKIKKINDVLINRYDIKYSTIVVFDGAEYVIKASNVEQKHWESLKSLQDVGIFKDSITTATPKYITVNKEGEQLPYQKSEFGRAKSAIFFPLYIDNVYIGYWILESGTPHDFDNVDTTVLEVIKGNIVSALKSVVHQKTLESMVRTDQFTGLQSEAYLYGEGKKIIDQFTTSTMCMFRIINLEYVNKNYSRELGNQMVKEVSKFILGNISDDYILIRYMGPKFVIAFSGIDTESVADFLNDLKVALESLKITENGLLQEDDESIDLTDINQMNDIEEFQENSMEIEQVTQKENEEEVYAEPILNFVISSYYKGTGLEEVLHKLEDYLDNADPNETEINNI